MRVVTTTTSEATTAGVAMAATIAAAVAAVTCGQRREVLERGVRGTAFRYTVRIEQHRRALFQDETEIF